MNLVGQIDWAAENFNKSFRASIFKLFLAATLCHCGMEKDLRFTSTKLWTAIS